MVVLLASSLLNEESSLQIHSDLKASFQAGKLKSIAYRKNQLLQLAYIVHDNVQRFQEALASDLGRPKLESNL